MKRIILLLVALLMSIPGWAFGQNQVSKLYQTSRKNIGELRLVGTITTSGGADTAWVDVSDVFDYIPDGGGSTWENRIYFYNDGAALESVNVVVSVCGEFRNATSTSCSTVIGSFVLAGQTLDTTARTYSLISPYMRFTVSEAEFDNNVAYDIYVWSRKQD